MPSGDILVVEDAYPSLKLLTEILTAAGYSVRPADSGELALAAAAARPPELVLLDIRMPGIDGFEVFRRLKARPETASVPIIFLSASADEADRLEGLRLGAVDFASKPFKREELLARVGTHIELFRLRSRLEALVAERTGELQKEFEEHKRAAEALRESQDRLNHSQKMEAVGRLAGGVAHDFNNILGAIQGYAGLLLRALPENDGKREDVEEILKATERAASLTRQLLAFSRRQILSPKVADMNAIVAATSKMLKRLIGEDISFETVLSAEACLVRVDPGQLEQVIMNLAVNARDAIRGGGAITLETEVLSAQRAAAVCPELRGGAVCLRMKDTGSGISDEVKKHLFEPFFTTKERGKGTGLGLSTIFGIVKQSGGEVAVESSPGKGSVFSIYLPYEAAAVPDELAPGVKAAAAGGSETILLVEDEGDLLRLAERLLRAAGYKVLGARNGDAALELLKDGPAKVDLLITDVVMPGMDGRELARRVTLGRGSCRVLYMSGYTDDTIARHGALEPGLAFIYKPFTMEALTSKVREVLDGPAAQAKA